MPILVQFTAIRSNARIIPAEAIRAELDEFTLTHCGNILNEIAPYPPVPPPPNRYVRTGRLLRNWRVRNTGTGDQVKYTIDNPVQDRRGRYYVRYVQGPSGQTWFHSAHGWKNIGDYKDRDRFRAGVQAIISRVGGAAV